MVRSHGWQLPSNGFQVLAITVFFLLLPAFYAFLAPFLGKRIFEYASIAIYSPLALAVFIRYIRCARINPADPGVIAKFDDEIIDPPNNNPRFQTNSFESRRNGTPFSPSSSQRSPDGDNSRHSAGQDAMIDIDEDPPRKTLSTCQVLRGKVHAVFAKEDCRKDDIAERQAGEQDSSFCKWCKVEVRKYSKHCRSCDKCVDEFDHHCWWLGNCVGRKNYVTFFSLILTSLVWFAVESGVGIAVLVLCFVDKKGTESKIVDKFGNGFSRAPFVTVVAVCTAVSFVASVLLGDLFIFHMILIKKGITTYEHVKRRKAMKEIPLASAHENDSNLLASQTNSTTTGLSMGNSPRGLWCTPGAFMDHHLYSQWRRTYY